MQVKPADRNRRPLCGTSTGVGDAGVAVSREHRAWRGAIAYVFAHRAVFRDGILFFVGLGGVIHEIFYTDLDRPALLVLFAGMMGLASLNRSNGH